MYGWIEARRYTPYPVELERIAEALEWRGKPDELLEDVLDDESA